MSKIQIFIGTVYGGAEQVAEILKDELEKLGQEVSLNTYARAEDLARDTDEIILLCHSNTGSGELPDNIQPLYLHLTRDYPRIAGRRYGVVNLADSSYTTFNEGGKMLDAAFEDLGAVRVGEPLVLDACTGDDEDAMSREWAQQWVKLL
ncbi:MAG: flavodoxin domain-containing protein [Cellvibrio sp.]|uniref:flavodoxin domain-containing protein n=1 Tax=Cellvibrio sp. TaxID=1965322 RepID=UPI0031A9050B